MFNKTTNKTADKTADKTAKQPVKPVKPVKPVGKQARFFNIRVFNADGTEQFFENTQLPKVEKTLGTGCVSGAALRKKAALSIGPVEGKTKTGLKIVLTAIP